MASNGENEDNPNPPVIGRAAVEPTGEPKPSQEDVDLRQFGSSRSGDPSFERLPVNKRHKGTRSVGSDGRCPRGGRGDVAVPSFVQWEDDGSEMADVTAAKVTCMLDRVEKEKNNKVGNASTTTRKLAEKAKRNGENEDNPNPPVIARAAVGPTGEPKPSREDVDLKQFAARIISPQNRLSSAGVMHMLKRAEEKKNKKVGNASTTTQQLDEKAKEKEDNKVGNASTTTPKSDEKAKKRCFSCWS